MHSRTKTWKVRNIEMTRLTLSFFLRSLFNAIPRSSLPRLGIMQIPLVSFLFFFLLFHFFARAESSEEGAGGVCAAETWAYDKKKKVEGASLFQTLSRRKMNLNLVWRQTQPSSFSLLTLVFFSFFNMYSYTLPTPFSTDPACELTHSLCLSLSLIYLSWPKWMWWIFQRAPLAILLLATPF